MKMCYLFVTIQAEPLVIDLKDLFQVIFNMRKKEAEASQKVTGSEAFDFKLEKVYFFFSEVGQGEHFLSERKAFGVVIWEG